jgi:hypothetical protein
MIIRRLLAAFLLLAPAIAFAQTEGVATFRFTLPHTSEASPNANYRMFFSRNAVRMEMQMDLSSRSKGSRPPGAPSTFTMTMIQKISDPDRIYTLSDAQKTYSVMDLAKIRQSAPQENETWTVKRLGRDRVAGIACDNAVMSSSTGNQVEVCIASDLVYSSGWWEAMNQRSGRSGRWVRAMADAGLKGFPIRMRFKSAKNEQDRVEMELVSLERKSVPASLFEIPAGYRETSGLVGMTPEQQKKMDDALAKMTPEQRKAYEDAMKKRE